MLSSKTITIIDIMSSIWISLIAIALTISVVLALFQGSLLTMWVFINSLQLIAHIPLVAISMPANAHYFLLNFLNLVRLNITALNKQLDTLDGEMTDYELSTHDGNFYSAALHNSGYSFNLVRNLIIIICIGAAIAMIWLFTAVIRVCRAKVLGADSSASSETFMNNVMVRFGLEALFELMICAMLTVSSPEASGAALWVSGLAILVVSGLALVALFSLFCSKRPLGAS